MSTPTTPPTRPPHGPGAPQRPEPGPEVGSGDLEASEGDTGLRDQIAALFRWGPDETPLHDEPPGPIADAVLAVVEPALAAKDREIERLRELLKVEAAVRSAARARRGRRR